MVRRLAAFCLSLWLVPAAASAQSAAQTREARDLWREGRSLAEQGDWEAALDRFERSFALVERASTALSIATAAVQLERPERALSALDDLERVADPERDAEHLEAGVLVRQHAEEQIATRPPPEPVEPVEPIDPVTPVEAGPPPEDEPGDSFGPFIGPTAVGGAALITFAVAIGTFVARQDALSERDALCPSQLCPDEAARQAALDRHADAETFNTATNATVIAGAILAAGAATWLVLAITLDGGGDDDAQVRIGPGRVSLAGRFP